jgi:signal transduction histidine kinase
LGLNRIFRNYCGFALVYFFAFYIYTTLNIGLFFSPQLTLFYINLANYAVLFGFLSWTWLEKKMGAFYFPTAIFMAAIIPMYSITFFWPFQTDNDLTQIIFRSWYLYPVLVVPITLIAWQYGYRAALIFVIFTALFDLPFFVLRLRQLNLETVQLLGVPILRTIAFGTVGVIVGLLMNTQRLQRKKLIAANVMLSRNSLALEELATSRERNRLARELHDTLAHTLSSQILTLEALRLSPPADEQEMQAVLNKMITASRNGLTETRRALKDLRSRPVEDLGLKQSLEYLLADTASRSDCTTTVQISDNLPPIPKEIEQCIYRLSQEGVENSIRHASASAITLSLSFADGRLHFQLADNGSGFIPSEAENLDTHGIKGMRERVAVVGGTFSIASSKKRGTKIIAEFEVADDPRIAV